RTGRHLLPVGLFGGAVVVAAQQLVQRPSAFGRSRAGAGRGGGLFGRRRSSTNGGVGSRFQQREAGDQRPFLLGGNRLQRFGLVANCRLLESAETSTGRKRVAQDDVFLQADQVVDRACQSGFGQHLGRLLERRGADEAAALHRRLGDAQKLRAGGGE